MLDYKNYIKGFIKTFYMSKKHVYLNIITQAYTHVINPLKSQKKLFRNVKFKNNKKLSIISTSQHKDQTPGLNF